MDIELNSSNIGQNKEYVILNDNDMNKELLNIDQAPQDNKIDKKEEIIPIRRRCRNKYRNRIKTSQKISYECNICEKSFIKKYTFRSHMARIHFGIQKFICQICGLTYSSKGGLTTHTKRLKGKCIRECDICNFKCRYQKDMKYHMESYHPDVINTHLSKCDICNITFKNTTWLKCQENRPSILQCPYCNSYVKLVSPLINIDPVPSLHLPAINVELGREDVPEVNSDMTYPDQVKLSKEEICCNKIEDKAIETINGPEIQPYIARELDYTMNTSQRECKQDKTKGQNVQTNENCTFTEVPDNVQNELHCPKCLLWFDSLADFNSHKKAYPDGRLKCNFYCCKICKESFAQKINFIQHNVMYHEGEMYTCIICSCNFGELFEMARHMDLHDKE